MRRVGWIIDAKEVISTTYVGKSTITPSNELAGSESKDLESIIN